MCKSDFVVENLCSWFLGLVSSSTNTTTGMAAMSDAEDPELSCVLGGTEERKQATGTLAVMQRAGISGHEVWLHYMSLGGDEDEFDVAAYLYGLLTLPVLERDMIAHAVNELFDDICRGPRAPYSSTSTHSNRNL